MSTPSYNQITKKEYDLFSRAYSYFNRCLFGGLLSDCMITLHRHPRAYGYHTSGAFAKKENVITGEVNISELERTSEIALNPDLFLSITDENILSTLVHEMAHLWQHSFGHPGRANYHNKEWADKMESIGLIPSDTGHPGGKKTGDGMSHYIQDGGPFDIKAKEFLKYNAINWGSIELLIKAGSINITSPDEPGLGKIHKPDNPNKQTRVKYTCSACNQNAWAKATANLICGDCNEQMTANP